MSEWGNYLVAAYVFVWLLHCVYVWSLGSRQKKINEEIELLSERLKGKA